jgi:ubiquinone/menaquinone biosynthesis C-methylase UbiE
MVRHMGQKFHDHFSAVAGRYAEFRPRYPKELFDYLAELAPGQSLAWDCAAGNGQATTDLAARFERIIATDASAEQLAAAQPMPNVEYRVATAEQSGLPDHCANLVTVAQALHWFDLDRFYAEVRRVLRPGGVLAVWAYGIDEVEGSAIDEIVQDFYSNIVGSFWPPERQLVEEGYRTLPFPFAEIQPPQFQMEMRWTLDQLLGYFGTWSATNRFIKAKGVSPLPAVRERLAKLWGEPKSARLVTWPLTLRVGRK